MHDRLIADGFETRAIGPAALRERIDAEGIKWRAVIVKAGIEQV